jgi:xylan 1,4-beta-xylosidase
VQIYVNQVVSSFCAELQFGLKFDFYIFMRPYLTILLLAAAAGAHAQRTVTIRVDASQKAGPLKLVWSYFGYDEPNYTYGKNGKKLIGELAALSKTPVYIRAHNLLTTGDGTPALKWGSTNAYTEDASGKPVYNWTIVDKILETYLHAGAKPLVEIGFMPKALSTHPDPYQHTFPNGSVFTGWSYPPNDYAKWSELVYQWVKHCVEKYGATEVESWDWEVWNEPNIGYWHGTPEEYNKLYDYSADAVKRALPSARVGGPGTTGPASEKAAAFLRQFLEHCSSGKNYATGKTGAPLDFISYHAKGQPQLVDQHVRMGISRHMKDVSEGFKIVRSFPKFKDLPIVLSESDPEGCAACSARTNPANAYRNGTLYPAYTAAAMKTMLQLADREHANLEGILTWAFEFEDQPYFYGFRTLATNGVDKPVLNVFRMAGLMEGDRVKAESDGALDASTILSDGVQQPEVDALASRSGHHLSTLIWHYQDDDVAGPSAEIHLNTSAIPRDVKRVLVRHYRIDQTHSNAYTLWKQMGSPQHPADDQYRALEDAGQLQLLESPQWIDARDGSAQLSFSLPLQGISLVDLSW